MKELHKELVSDEFILKPYKKYLFQTFDNTLAFGVEFVNGKHFLMQSIMYLN